MNASIGEPADILVVDDTAANLEILCRMLKKNGYKTRPAPNGKLALRAAAAQAPDLILLDINMPEMNGYQVCKSLKQDKGLREIPVLFLSARMETEDKVTAFEAGGVDYITKPFQVKEVLARIRTHLEIRRLQLELKAKNRHLMQTMDRLEKTQAQLVASEKQAVLGVLTAGIAHEINNPVNFIKTSVDALQHDFNDLLALVDVCSVCHNPEKEAVENEVEFDTLKPEIRDLFQNIEEGVRRTREIVSSLGVFSRKDDSRFSAVELEQILESALVILKNRYKNRIRIQKKYMDSLKVDCIPGKLGQVFTNILINAMDAIEEKKDTVRDERIFIETGTSNKEGRPFAFVRISDTGPGIDPDKIQQIFDPFFTTKEVGKGVGLGLYISHEIVRDHDGFMNAGNIPGKGAEFCVFIPIKRE